MRILAVIGRALIIALLLFALIAPLVLAATNPPDSTPSLEDIYVYRHLMESDDFLAIAKYNLPYASPPSATIAQAYFFRMLDTDNTTVLLSNEAYPYVTNGYGYGLIAFYASAADAPTWGQAYTIQLLGKPSEFTATSNVTWSYPVPTGAYSTYGTQAANQADLAAKIIGIAQDLEVAWNVTLLAAGDVGQVFSSNGEIYFGNSISGLKIMAPSLYDVQVEDPDYTSENWTNAQATTYRTRLSGTWLNDTFQDVATLFGMEFHFLASIPLAIASLFCVIAGSKQNNIWSGLIGVSAIGIYGVLQGFTPFLILSIATILVAAFVGYRWFLKSTG